MFGCLFFNFIYYLNMFKYQFYQQGNVNVIYLSIS